MKPETDTADLGQAKTLKAAVGRTKLPLHVIQAAKNAGCKAFNSNGSIDCDALVKFVETMPESLSDEETPDYYIERAKDIRANRMLKEQKLKEREKHLIPIETIRHSWTRNVVACKTKLFTAENAIATEAGMKLGLTPEQINNLREIGSKHIRFAIKELHKGEYGKTECPICKGEIQ